MFMWYVSSREPWRYDAVTLGLFRYGRMIIDPMTLVA